MNKLLCAVTMLFISHLSFAQIEIDGNNKKLTLDCKGQKVEVGGSGHVINLKGDCTKVEIMGTNNTIAVNNKNTSINDILDGNGNLNFNNLK